MIKQVLDTRPPNVIDFFEEYSRNLREQRVDKAEHFNTIDYKSTIQHTMADKIITSLKLPQIIIDEIEFCEEAEQETEIYQDKNANKAEFGRNLSLNENFLLMQYHWSLCGLSFNQQEVYQLSLSLQNLQQHPAVANCRFWGKIFGLKKSYIVAEVDLKLDEIKKREALMLNEINERISWYSKIKNIDKRTNSKLMPGTNWSHYPSQDLLAMKPIAADIPTSQYVSPFDIPPEIIGTGLNRKSYFVINEPTDVWMELPIVTPKQIDVARKIRKFFTGDLESEIFSYPLFPGREKHFLRATIARITSGTYISPVDYYRRQGTTNFGEEVEEEGLNEDMEEDEILDNDDLICLNENYKSLNQRDLMQLSNWVHYRPHIISQGRIKFFNMKKELKNYQKQHNMLGNEFQEEEFDEEEEEETVDEISEGPSLFANIRCDKIPENFCNWSMKLSSIHNQINRVVLVKSNLWPGSYTFNYELITDSIYIGWGQKYISRNFSPIHLPSIQEEYPKDTTVTEIFDPTQEEEALYQLSKVKHGLQQFNDTYEETEEGEEEETD